MSQFRDGPKELVVTYVKGEGTILKFWAWQVAALNTVKKFENHFEQIKETLQNTSGFLNSIQTPVGYRCGVFVKTQQKWCRARVLNVLGLTEISVQLLDYGNEEIVSVADVRNLDDTFFRTPPQALECILADVVPSPLYSKEWSSDAIKFCEQQLRFQTLTGFTMSTYDKLPVMRIAKKGENEPFVQRLINNNLAHIKPEGPVHQVQPPAPPTLTYKVNQLDQNSTHLVRISFLESPQKFFVQLAAADVELRKLMDDIKQYTKLENLMLVNAPIVNTPCLAQFSNKQLYYRALITSVLHGHCTILFVDYGCVEIKEFQDLKAIPPRFLTLQAQAICCSLPQLGDINYDEFNRIAKCSQLNCQILGRNSEAYVVRLTQPVQDFAQPVFSSGSTQVMSYKCHTLNVNSVYDVTVSFANDVGEFYCQVSSYREQLDALSFALTSGYALDPMTLPECKPGLPVCVKFSEDDVYYRAQIVHINHENDIEVFFVDFGNYDNASLRDVRKLNAGLMRLPAQAHKCSLYEIEPPTDAKVKDNMFEFFEEMTSGQILKAHIKEVTDQHSYMVILQDPNATDSLNEKIKSKFQTISVSEIEHLYITSFTSPALFFAHFEKFSSTKLEEMQAAINDFYFNAPNAAFKPVVGSLVCAKYNMDNQFYRARLENVIGANCEVLFIDYGNRESLSIRDIRPMNKKFMNYPQFGVECGFEEIPPATPVEKLQSLMVDNSVQARMIRQQNNKWLITLTENFAGNVAILELLRQHENLVPRSIHGAGLRGFQENTASSFPTNNEYLRERNGYENIWKPDTVITQRNDQALNRNQYAVPPLRQELNEVKKSFDIITIPPKAYRNAFVSHVISPSDFYCQIEEESSKLDLLMKSIAETYSCINDNDLTFDRLVADSPCCAVFEEDSTWYRGLIKEVGPRSCSVYFIDYGNADDVVNSNIKVLQREFFDLPPQAIRCKSFNVSPKSGTWNETEINTFTDMTLEKSFVAQFVESDSKHTYAVNLVSIGKIQEEGLNKEFSALVHGQAEHSNNVSSTSRSASSNLSFQKNIVPAPPSNVAFTKPSNVAIPEPTHVASSDSIFREPSVQLGSTASVTITYGLNPREVFCQLKSSENDFQRMMNDLQAYYQKVSPTEAMIDRPQQGMICVAQFFMDSAWYRGEIRKVENNQLTVCYIDYGNCETVDKRKLRSISQNFTILPVQGIKCCLKGIKPSGSTNQDISRYFEGDAQCHFISKDRDSYVVDIVCNRRNVSEQLISDGVAVSTDPVAKQTVAPLQLKPKEHQSAQTLLKREMTFVSGQLLSVLVSFVDSPYKFWCQLIDESETLDQLMADIEDKYLGAANSPVDASNLTTGSYCMAKYSADDAWYRAQILSSLSRGEYKIFFIDYGNSETTTIGQLSVMQPEFFKVPPQCFECRLHRAPSASDATATEQFQTITSEAEELMIKVERVVGSVYITTIFYDKDGEEVNISDLIFGESNELESSTTLAIPKFLPPDVPLGLQEGYVTEVNSPHDFFIQLVGIEDELADLSTELTDNCEAATKAENKVTNPSVGYVCSAKYSEDNNWYRAEIIAVQETTVDVLFADYGNGSNVPIDSLKVLEEKFLNKPPYAIRCKLNGIAPTGEEWAQASTDSFHDMLSDSLIGITFISKDIPALVNISKDDKDLAQSLIDLELAAVDTSPETQEAYTDDHLTTVEDQLHSLPSDLGYPKRKLGSSKFPVKISYIDSYEKFYFMPLELNTELDTVMKTLEILYTPDAEKSQDGSKSSVPEVLEDPSVSMACVAKYSEDEAWYRAVITDIEGENICVTFIDYGNSEMTTLENLKPLTPELIKIPPIALACKLYATEAAEGKEEAVTAKLEELLVEEVEMDIEIIQFSEPLIVKLYHDGDLAEALCKEGLVVISTPPTETEDESLIENINDNVKENLKTAFVELPEEASGNIPARSLAVEGKVLVCVKHCEIENGMVTFHAVQNDLEDDLADLGERLQTVYNATEGRMSEVNCKDFCIAKYKEDELWYRAQVNSCDGDDIKVKFVDYGNAEVVGLGDISELSLDFLSVPQFALKFCLFGYTVKEGKETELQDKLDEHIYNEPILVKLCTNSHKLPNICAIDLICKETSIVEMLAAEKLLSQQYTVNSEIGENFRATVETIVDDLFYMLPVDLIQERDNLQTGLKDACCVLNPITDELDAGQLYAAEFEDKWSRLSILSVDASSNSALVMRVDYGTNAEIACSKLRLLPDQFCHRPLILQPCVITNLDDTPPCIKDKNIETAATHIFQCKVQDESPLHYPLIIKLFKCHLPSLVTDVVSIEVDELVADDSISSQDILLLVATKAEEDKTPEEVLETVAEAVISSQDMPDSEIDNVEFSTSKDTTEVNDIGKQKTDLEEGLFEDANEATTDNSTNVEICEVLDSNMGVPEIVNQTSDAFYNEKEKSDTEDLLDEFLDCTSDMNIPNLPLEADAKNTTVNSPDNCLENDVENSETEDLVAVCEELVSNVENVIEANSPMHAEVSEESGVQVKSHADETLSDLQHPNDQDRVESAQGIEEEDYQVESNKFENQTISPDNCLENEVENSETEDLVAECEELEPEATSVDRLSNMEDDLNIEADALKHETKDPEEEDFQAESSDHESASDHHRPNDQESDESARGIEVNDYQVESSKLENLVASSTVEDNEWDERPECDIKQITEESKGSESVEDQGLTFEIADATENLCSSDHRSDERLPTSLDDNEANKLYEKEIIITNQSDVEPEDKIGNSGTSDQEVISSEERLPTGLDDDDEANTLYGEENITSQSNVEPEDKIGNSESSDQEVISSQETLPTCLDDEANGAEGGNVEPDIKIGNSEMDIKNKKPPVQGTGNDVSAKIIEDGNPIQVNNFCGDQDIQCTLLSEGLVMQEIAKPVINSGKYTAKLSHLTTDAGNLQLFVNIVYQLNDLQKLQNAMKNVYPLNDKVPAVESGVYAVLHNGTWRRSKAVTSGDRVVLRLVDSGETIPITSELYPLSPEHCLHPPYATLCQINETIPDCENIVDDLEGVFGVGEFNIEIEADSESRHLTAQLVDEYLIEQIKSLSE